VSTRYLLVFVLVSFTPLLCGSTVVTATSSCQVFHFGSPDPIFTQSQNVAFTTNAISGEINGLDCVTPFGSVVYPGPTSFTSKADVFETLASLFTGTAVNAMEVDHVLFGFAHSAHIHVSTQNTFIASGGTGIGILKGTSRGFSDTFGTVSATGSDSLTTPFGGCPPTCSEFPVVPFSFQFVFGQPFTIDVESDLAFEVSLSSTGVFSTGASFGAGLQSVVDANGNPIPGVAFTAVPEPGSALLGGAALLLGAVFVVRLQRTRPNRESPAHNQFA
jgi:hypothetical protein